MNTTTSVWPRKNSQTHRSSFPVQHGQASCAFNFTYWKNLSGCHFLFRIRLMISFIAADVLQLQMSRDDWQHTDLSFARSSELGNVLCVCSTSSTFCGAMSEMMPCLTEGVELSYIFCFSSLQRTREGWRCIFIIIVSFKLLEKSSTPNSSHTRKRMHTCGGSCGINPLALQSQKSGALIDLFANIKINASFVQLQTHGSSAIFLNLIHIVYILALNESYSKYDCRFPVVSINKHLLQTFPK